MPRLVVFRGDAVENEIRLSGGAVRIGRHAGNDVVLDDSLNGVSRFHAEIRPEGNSYVIVDLNSRNGVWIGGKRIKDKAALLLGVPVTVGAFELALEDDPSGTFDGPVASPRTVATVPLGDTGRSASSASSSASRSGAPVSASRSTPRPRPASSMSPQNKQILIWAGAIIGVLAICVVTYTMLRRTTPPPQTQVAQAEPPPTTTIVSAPVGQRAAARSAAPDLVSKLEVLAEPETRDIPRGSAEAVPEYTARVRGIQVTLAEGKAALAKGEYGGALARFRLVARAAPTFKGVDALIADATARQQAAADKAIENGQQNETANNLVAARRWYDQALQLNPSSVVAREKRVAVMAKMNHAAAEIYSQAMAAQKIQNLPLARRLFQQVFDQTMPGDEYREKAQKQLELLR